MKDALDMKHLPKLGAVKKTVRKKKGSWDFGGKTKYQRAREKQIRLAEKREHSEKNPAKRLTIKEGREGLERMNREYTRREKGESRSNW